MIDEVLALLDASTIDASDHFMDACTNVGPIAPMAPRRATFGFAHNYNWAQLAFCSVVSGIQGWEI